jgi:hypothetical protein
LIGARFTVYNAAPVNADDGHDTASGVVSELQAVMLASPTFDECEPFVAVFWDLGKAAIRWNRDRQLELVVSHFLPFCALRRLLSRQRDCWRRFNYVFKNRK